MINLPDTIFGYSSSGGVWRQLSLSVVPSDWPPGCQPCHGISGRLGVEYASKHRDAFCESYRSRRNSITTLKDVMVVFLHFLIVEPIPFNLFEIGCCCDSRTLFLFNKVFRTGSDLRRWSTHTEVSTRIIEQARPAGEVYTPCPVHCHRPRPTNGRHLSRVYLLGCPQSPNSAFFFRKVTFQCIDIGKLCKIPATKTARIVYTHQPLGTYGS